jgi:signal transduction histidine kinase
VSIQVLENQERKVLVLPPTRRDGDVTRALLRDVGLDCDVVGNAKMLASQLNTSIGAVVLTDAAVADPGLSSVMDALDHQPQWSDMPVILLSKLDKRSAADKRRFGKLTNLTVLDRPTSGRALVSAVEAAMRGRARQYQIRDQLNSLQEADTALALDATERKNADRRKDEFLATLAHELRNPLAPIRTGLQALARPGGEGAAGTVIRAIMERQLSQMVRLIDDLLDVSRISSGKVVLQRTRVDLRAIAELAIEASQPFIAAGQHDFTAELPPGPVWVDGDASRLAQVIINLLNNAAKYTDEGGKLRLSLSSDEAHAIVRVQDNGVGIPPEMLNEVFDMFAQVNRTLDRSQGGLGIGLSLVRRLTEMHGGKVTAESEGLGQGSVFTVRIPVMATAELPAESHEAPDPEPSKRPGLRVLVVDDIPDVADVLKMLLDLEGFETRVAYSGAVALDSARDFRPDVVICDIGLPEMDGHEIARRLRRDPGSAPATLIALTGWGTEGEVRRTRESGFDFHLVKPVDANALLELLSHVEPRA